MISDINLIKKLEREIGAKKEIRPDAARREADVDALDD